MPTSRLPGSLRVLLGASFVSSVGGGLTLPFLVIYLHQVRHIPLGIAGLLIGGVAVLALPVSPLAGALVDRVGAREVVLVTMVVQGLGIASLATVHSVGTASTGPVRLRARAGRRLADLERPPRGDGRRRQGQPPGVRRATSSC